MEGKHVLAVRGSPVGGGGTKTGAGALQSWKKRSTEFNLLIKFRTSGHEGLDRARHSGVSSVSHKQLSHTHRHTHTVAGQ